MIKVVSFLKLIRLPNLIFILLTQGLFYCLFFYACHIYTTDAIHYPVKLQPHLFWILALSSVSLAAAGYIINDYCDIEMDLINKPNSVFIGKTIEKNISLVFYFLLNLTGLAASLYLSIALDNYWIVVLNSITSVLLFFYSRQLKKQLLTGNILISILTSWTILVLPVSEFGTSRQDLPVWKSIWTAAIVYGTFAFLISLAREVVKDMEDTPGDTMAGCTTLPIVWGIGKSKIYARTLLLILLAMVGIFMVYSFAVWRWVIIVYGTIFLVAPLIVCVIRLYYSEKPPEFHKLSSLIKWIMFSGILSMIFFDS